MQAYTDYYNRKADNRIWQIGHLLLTPQNEIFSVLSRLQDENESDPLTTLVMAVLGVVALPLTLIGLLFTQIGLSLSDSRQPSSDTLPKES